MNFLALYMLCNLPKNIVEICCNNNKVKQYFATKKPNSVNVCACGFCVKLKQCYFINYAVIWTCSYGKYSSKNFQYKIGK